MPRRTAKCAGPTLAKGLAMTFGEAISWCKENGATWSFRVSGDATSYVLSLDVGGERVEIRRRDATEWACMLLDAIDVYLERCACVDEPTLRVQRPTFAPAATRRAQRSLRAAS